MLYYSPFAYFLFFISHSNGSFKLGPVTNYADTAPEAFGRLCHATTVQRMTGRKMMTELPW